MNTRRQLLVPLMTVGVLSVLPGLALAQVLPGWDFSVSAFGGGAFPFATDIKSGDITVEDVKLNNSVSFGGKIGAWTTVGRASTGLDFGAEVDVTQFYPDTERQPSASSSTTPPCGAPSCPLPPTRTGNGVGIERV